MDLAKKMREAYDGAKRLKQVECIPFCCVHIREKSERAGSV